MEMTNTRIVPAPPAKVWNALNDPATLKACIPGCDSLELVGENEWRAVMAAKVSPVSARFTGTMKMTDSHPPDGYTLQFEGQGGAAGFARGQAVVSLAASGDAQTALTYAVKAQVGGKLAQIGSRLVDGAAAKLAEDFFGRFAQSLQPAGAAERDAAAMLPSAAGEAPSGRRWIRYIALAAIAAVIWYLMVYGIR